jgi:hypothetical protein
LSDISSLKIFYASAINKEEADEAEDGNQSENNVYYWCHGSNR